VPSSHGNISFLWKQKRGQKYKESHLGFPCSHPRGHTLRCPSHRRTHSYRDLPYNLRIKCPLSWDLKGFLLDWWNYAVYPIEMIKPFSSNFFMLLKQWNSHNHQCSTCHWDDVILKISSEGHALLSSCQVLYKSNKNFSSILDLTNVKGILCSDKK
jgi:hypothetical protein